MRTTLILSLAFLLCQPHLIQAQEKPSPVPKPSTDPRSLGIALPDSLSPAAARDSSAKVSQSLPKFDLPEYVITGAVTFDLPESEKLNGDETPHFVVIPDPIQMPRDRSTAGLFSMVKEPVADGEEDVFNGRLLATSGTHFNSTAGLILSRLTTEYDFVAEARYNVAKEYLPFTNRSGGLARVIGGMMLHGPSEWYDQGRLSGEVGYGADTYRFFGSGDPSLTRTASRFDAGARFASPKERVFGYEGHAGVSVFSLSDSSSSVAETQFRIGTTSNLLVGAFPLDGSIDFILSSISGSGSPALPYLEAGLHVPRQWISDFYVQGAVRLYVTQGMRGQKFARVYPRAALGYRLFDNSIASLSYDGRVQFNTLRSLVDGDPYLSATAILRQTDIPVDITAAVETDWNVIWRTRFAIRHEAMREYPLLTEGGQQGVWTTAYGGTTSLTTFSGDVFAKFGANTYFTLSVDAFGSRNTLTDDQIPYLPKYRVSTGLSTEVLEGLSVEPSIAYVGRRLADLKNAPELSAYLDIGLHAEYSVFRSLNIVLNIQNLSNSKYEEWRGYRAAPFILTGGLGYRW